MSRYLDETQARTQAQGGPSALEVKGWRVQGSVFFRAGVGSMEQEQP